MSEGLVERLSSDDSEVRNEAIVEASESRDEAVVVALGGLVISPDVGTPARTAAAQTLARMPDAVGVDQLKELLRHENPEFRVLAASGLEFHPDPGTVKVLLAALGDPVNKVRNVAERSLLAMTCVFTEESHQQIAGLLDHPVPLTRSPAARLVGAAAITGLAPRLARMAVEDQEWLPRVWSSRALGELGEHANLEVLERVVTSDPENRVRAAAVEAPRVTAVFPSGERVPANLLKLYVHFSRPMATGEVYRRIRLLDAGGDEVAHPFLELDEELWNRGGTRVTVFFDPGRVKRELRPNAEVGPALVAGETYTIDIDAAWPSADGVPLAGVHRRTLRVEDPDRTSPDPAAWSLTPPLAGTRDPLVLAFPEPLDHALLERLLWIRGPDNVEVDGEVRVGDRERVWSFRPVGSWAAGVHQLVVGSALEDLAGNSVDRLFEVEVFREIRVPVVSTDVSLEFRVEPPDSSRREP